MDSEYWNSLFPYWINWIYNNSELAIGIICVVFLITQIAWMFLNHSPMMAFILLAPMVLCAMFLSPIWGIMMVFASEIILVAIWFKMSDKWFTDELETKNEHKY